MISLIERAARIATDAHAGQVRKSDGSPYIVHPFMCAHILTTHNFDEMTVAAALVHDVLEDTNTTEEVLRKELGDDVLRIVRAVSEDKTLPWKERKHLYIETVRNASDEAKAVSVADKIHNAQTLLDACEKQGEDVWNVFNRGKEQKLQFETRMLSMLRESWEHPLVGTYATLVQRLVHNPATHT